jgi:hypothetical protein
MTQITYLDGPYECVERPLAWQTAGLQQTASGYGRKLTTAWVIRRKGETRWRRVYAVCFSSAASHYVLIKGQPRYFAGDFREGVA